MPFFVELACKSIDNFAMHILNNHSVLAGINAKEDFTRKTLAQGAVKVVTDTVRSQTVPANIFIKFPRNFIKTVLLDSARLL